MRRIAGLSCRWHRFQVDHLGRRFRGGRSASPLEWARRHAPKRSPQCSAIELAPVRDAREEGQRHDGRVTYLHGGLHRPGRFGRSCRDRHTRSSHQRPSGLGTACRTRGGRAKRLFGLGYPRDTRVVRLIIIAMNLMLGLQRRPVRAFFRSGDAIERIVRENGLDLTLRRTSAPRGRSLSFAENEPAARSDEAAARLLIEGELKR